MTEMDAYHFASEATTMPLHDCVAFLSRELSVQHILTGKARVITEPRFWSLPDGCQGDRSQIAN